MKELIIVSVSKEAEMINDEGKLAIEGEITFKFVSRGNLSEHISGTGQVDLASLDPLIKGAIFQILNK